MFLLINNYDNENLILSEKQKNNILPGSDFYRLYYSDEDLTLNGIFIKFNIKNINIQKYFNKVKCCFDEEINKNEISSLITLEKKVLKKFKDYIKKEPDFIIKEQLKQCFIKIFTEKQIKFGKYNNINLLIKISGIWVQQQKYGLTFRFLIAN